MGTSKHLYFVRCITEGDKQGEGTSVQIHTTWGAPPLQNRRCSSVALCLFLVLQASCPPYNPVLVSELPRSHCLGLFLLLKPAKLLQVRETGDLFSSSLLAWEIGHHDKQQLSFPGVWLSSYKQQSRPHT